MRRRSGLPDLSTAEALAPSDSSALSAKPAAACAPPCVKIATAEPASAVSAPQAVPATPQAKAEPPPAQHHESSDSASSEQEPPGKRARRAAVSNPPVQPQRKAENAAPALPAKQVCTANQHHVSSCDECSPTLQRAIMFEWCAMASNVCGSEAPD